MMKKAKTCGDLYVVTFRGAEICPLTFYTRVKAERTAKVLNRAGNYSLYKAVKYRTLVNHSGKGGKV